tara:strand:- start:414 stop:1688 length:1275 start_codon:yes stop_codon:yes gene_type:complete
MGGGSNTTNTGLGDDQFQTLADNQYGISEEIVDARADAGQRYDQFDNRFDGIDSSISGANDAMGSGFANIQELLGQYSDRNNTANARNFSNLNNNMGTGFSNNNSALADNNRALGTLQTDVTGGFNTMEDRFNTVDTANTNIQSTVDQGFTDQQQGFQDAQTDRAANLASANAVMDQGFAATEQGFDDTSTQLTQTQANVLGGQGELQTDLETMSNTADIYAGQSLENQEELKNTSDGFVSSFDDYTTRYGEDTEVAQQSRADLSEAQANQTDRLREDMGRFAQASTTGQRGLSSQLDNISAQAERGFVDQNSTTMRTTDDILDSLDSNQILAARDMARQASFIDNIGEEARVRYNQLGASFDDNGELIRNSIDARGNSMSRQIDQQGNLILNTFDTAGTQTGNSVINIQNSLQELNSLQNSTG